MKQEEMPPCSFQRAESTAPRSSCPSGQLVPRRSSVRAEGAEGVGRGLFPSLFSAFLDSRLGLLAWCLCHLCPPTGSLSSPALGLPAPQQTSHTWVPVATSREVYASRSSEQVCRNGLLALTWKTLCPSPA